MFLKRCQVISGSDDETLRVWDLGDLQALKSAMLTDRTKRVALTGTGKLSL
jgi:hypothetical protein